MKRICLFCGSSSGRDPACLEGARSMARAIVGRGMGIVYGGGNVGMMGAAADAALDAGGEVIGVIPESLLALEVGHAGLTELRVVATMHERKRMMADLSGAFIAMPGGFGTMEELFEVLTWAQLGIHGKPCALLNIAGYYDRLIALCDSFVEEGFSKPEHRALLMTETDPETLLDRIAAYTPPPLARWITDDET
ncbi:MAG: Rossman fold protein family [Chlorobi bacterium]|nr:Rossman fold protein family [Chlorobiota bacterium]